MKIAPPPLEYDQTYEFERNREIELTDQDNQKEMLTLCLPALMEVVSN